MILEKVYDELMAQIEDLKKAVSGGGSGTKNYNDLDNRPYINSKLLTGNKNSKQIGVAEYITAENYAALESPSEHEIYFVSDRPAAVAWGFTKPTAQIHWTEGDNTYTATVSAAIGAEGEFYKSIISATVDDDAVSIESSALEHSPVHAVVLSISCDDPEAITATGLDFMFSFAAETGQRRIIHNGMEYGTGNIEVKKIDAGTGTTSRSFTFSKKPKAILAYWINSTDGYAGNFQIVYGENKATWIGKTGGAGVADSGISTLSYSSDGLTMTITGQYAWGAMNSGASSEGTMVIIY